MGSLKGVWLNGRAPSHRITPHNQILPIRHVMVSSPLRAVIEIVPSARLDYVGAGSRHENGKSSASLMFMLSLPCHISSIRWHCRIQNCFIAFYSKQVPPRYWKLRPIPNVLVPKSVFSVFCIPGDKICVNIRTFIV